MDRTHTMETATAEAVGWEIMSAADVEGADAPKVVEWEDLEQEIARLWSLSSALRKAKELKETLARRLESIVEVKRESLEQTNELEGMRQKLEARKVISADLPIHTKKVSESVEMEREQLCVKIRTLLVAGKTLSAAHNQLKEASKLLSGENGMGRLKNLEKLRRMRQQYMVAQVSSLYPVKVLNKQILLKKIDSRPGVIRSGVVGSSSHNVPKSPSLSNITILGLQLTTLPVKKTNYFTDKKEVQRSATALGYVAHVVQLIASCLDIPLRYPLRLGGSHSYIHDYAPSVESSSSNESLIISPILSAGLSAIPTEFPLFFESQDTTRSSYAVFLLNKDLEQLLNYIGAESLGPRHILANLKELLRIIQSDQYIQR